MNRKKHSQLFIVFVLFSSFFLNLTWPSYAKNLITVDEALRKVFRNATQFSSKTLVLSEEQITVIEKKARIIFGANHSAKIQMHTAKEGDQILGFALEDIVIGKWGPIHYLVGLDRNGMILQVIVLDYQEIRGRPIAKKRFLRQYNKKSISNPVKLRKDIDGVTGATISSRSLTNGIRKLLFIFEEVGAD